MSYINIEEHSCVAQLLRPHEDVHCTGHQVTCSQPYRCASWSSWRVYRRTLCTRWSVLAQPGWHTRRAQFTERDASERAGWSMCWTNRKHDPKCEPCTERWVYRCVRSMPWMDPPQTHDKTLLCTILLFTGMRVWISRSQIYLYMYILNLWRPRRQTGLPPTNLTPCMYKFA